MTEGNKVHPSEEDEKEVVDSPPDKNGQNDQNGQNGQNDESVGLAGSSKPSSSVNLRVSIPLASALARCTV